MIIGFLLMADKKFVTNLRKKYMDNPPKVMTRELVRDISDSDLMNIVYFLTEENCDDEDFFIF